ncbi:hypothetical protein CK204_09905 [Klebsiella pneumoniae]|nr:hypothetical protein CK204_09905 [Klebsiella pneumoniae]HBX5921432.1 hypothetical protein [Klebsiella pneumoniae]
MLIKPCTHIISIRASFVLSNSPGGKFLLILVIKTAYRVFNPFIQEHLNKSLFCYFFLTVRQVY